MQNFLTNGLFSGKDMAMLEGIGNAASAVGNKIGEVVPPLWNAYAPEAAKVPVAAALDKFGRLSSFASRASDIAEREFPNSPRDSSDKNAFRHALGTGILTRELGGNQISGLAAKMAGYGWEAMDAKRLIKDPQHRTDTLHDLNANAIGANYAAYPQTEAELIARLKTVAQAAPMEQPPSLFSGKRNHMTRTER
jgi:hypothetical protein